MYLAGEWINAWLWMSITFLVAAAGVIGLGWWVLRGNRAASAAAETKHEPEHAEHH